MDKAIVLGFLFSLLLVGCLHNSSSTQSTITTTTSVQVSQITSSTQAQTYSSSAEDYSGLILTPEDTKLLVSQYLDSDSQRLGYRETFNISNDFMKRYVVLYTAPFNESASDDTPEESLSQYVMVLPTRAEAEQVFDKLGYSPNAKVFVQPSFNTTGLQHFKIIGGVISEGYTTVGYSMYLLKGNAVELIDYTRGIQDRAEEIARIAYSKNNEPTQMFPELYSLALSKEETGFSYRSLGYNEIAEGYSITLYNETDFAGKAGISQSIIKEENSTTLNHLFDLMVNTTKEQEKSSRTFGVTVKELLIPTIGDKSIGEEIDASVISSNMIIINFIKGKYSETISCSKCDQDQAVNYAKLAAQRIK